MMFESLKNMLLIETHASKTMPNKMFIIETIVKFRSN